MKHVCIRCNKETETNQKTKKFCSKSCKLNNTLSKNVRHKIRRELRKPYYSVCTPPWQAKAPLVDLWQGRPEGMFIDHIIPRKGKIISGLNVPWNIQYLTHEENNKKSNSFDGTYNNDSWKK